MAALSEPIRTILIDSNDVSRAGLRALLAEDGDFAVIGDSATGGVSLAQQLKPTLIIVDPVMMGELDIALVAELVAAAPQCHICVRTNVSRADLVSRTFEVGAVGYLLRRSGNSTFLLDALRLVGYYGARVIDPNLVGVFQKVEHDPPLRVMLSDRESFVLRELARGLTRAQIAVTVGLSRRTVDRTMKRLFEAFAVTSSPELIAEAIRYGSLS